MKKREFKDVLSSLMDEKNFSPSSLGREIGVAYQTVQKYLAGTAKPKSETKAKLAKVLGVSISVLETGVEPITDRVGILLDATALGTSAFGFVLGVPVTLVVDWLAGRRPTDDELMTMTEVFDVSYAWLREGVGPFAPDLLPSIRYWREVQAYGDGERPNQTWIDNHAPARIEAIRQRLGLRRAEFADKVGIDEWALPKATATIDGQEGGSVRDHIAVAKKVAEKLKVNLPWITLGAGPSGMEEFDIVIGQRPEYSEQAMVEGQDRLLAALARFGFRYDRPLTVPMAPPNEDLLLLLGVRQDDPQGRGAWVDPVELVAHPVTAPSGKPTTKVADGPAADTHYPTRRYMDPALGEVVGKLEIIWTSGDKRARRIITDLLEEITDRLRGG